MSKSNLKKITAAAMMASLSIILERFLAFPPASQDSVIRISFGNVPIILSGILISPLYGGACGIVSDIIGCFISGYAPYPWLLPAPFIMGLLPGFLFKIIRVGKNEYNRLKTSASLFGFITITHIFSSVVVTTYGLSIMNGLDFVQMLVTRIPTMIIGLFIDVILVCILYVPLKDTIKVYFRKSVDNERAKKNDKRKNK